MPSHSTPTLSKSRFRLGWECPSKLYYANNRDIYYDIIADDPFIRALADGGYQVGELARWMLCRDPENDLIRALDKQQALEQTARRLEEDTASVAEAAFEWSNLFIRADVVVKSGSLLKLYEVKSKSWDRSVDFWSKRGSARLNSRWEEYLLDVAFQHYVISRARPDLTVQAHLVLLNKGKKASVDGLACKFTVIRNGNDVNVISHINRREDLGADLLAYVDVDADIKRIDKLPFELPQGGKGRFGELIEQLASINASGKPFYCGIGSRCKKCQFHFPADAGKAAALMSTGMQDGREECWSAAIGANYNPRKPKIVDLWNFRKADELIASGKFYMTDIAPEDLGDKKAAKRQMLQIDAVKAKEPVPWIGRDQLALTMSSWKYPLHFIDFETARMALPMHKGMPPYMQVAFQFSHHTVDGNGTVSHASQWIEPRAGIFPSFEFVRALMAQLGKDDGSIFRYAAHENTVLRDIRDQLEVSNEPDRRKLIRWIDTITEYKLPDVKTSEEKIRGSRNMVDMREVVLSSHYEPATHGSNSLKYVLPAILGSSVQLRERYSETIESAGIHSLNFDDDWRWLQHGQGINPYSSLPPIFEADEAAALTCFVEGIDDIDDGGAATIAYAKLQYCEITDFEREKIRDALLRYCELDTLAMVMLYQYWQEVLSL